MKAGPSDAALAARAAAGDDAAFGALVARHRPALVRTAASRLGTFASEAEDVVQDALGRAHAHLLRRGAPESVEAWLHTIVRNRAIDVVRHHPGRRGVPLEDHDGGDAASDAPDAILDRRDRMRDVIAAVGHLPGRQRDALVGVVFSGSTYEEVAAEQATSVPAVKALVNRARRTVRAAAAALLPIPGVLRDRVGLLLAGSEPSAALGFCKGCAVVGAVGTLSLTVAPKVAVPLHPPNAGTVAAAPHLSTRELAHTVARAKHAKRASPSRTLAAAATASAPDARPRTTTAALATCASSGSLAGTPEPVIRRALRTMPADVEEYTTCAQDLRAQLRHGA